VPRMMNFMVS